MRILCPIHLKVSVSFIHHKSIIWSWQDFCLGVVNRCKDRIDISHIPIATASHWHRWIYRPFIRLVEHIFVHCWTILCLKNGRKTEKIKSLRENYLDLDVTCSLVWLSRKCWKKYDAQELKSVKCVDVFMIFDEIFGIKNLIRPFLVDISSAFIWPIA